MFAHSGTGNSLSDEWRSNAVSALLKSAHSADARATCRADASQRNAPFSDIIGMFQHAEVLFSTARISGAHLAAVAIEIGEIADLGPQTASIVRAHIANLVAMNIQPGVDLASLSTSELLLALPEADLTWADTFAARLCGTLHNRPLECEGHLLTFTAKAGVSAISPQDQAFSHLIDRARAARRADQICEFTSA